MRENNIIKSSDYPNMIAPLRNGTYQFMFSERGLEVWPIDSVYEGADWFNICGPGIYAVYGISKDKMVVMPLDR